LKSKPRKEREVTLAQYRFCRPWRFLFVPAMMRTSANARLMSVHTMGVRMHAKRAALPMAAGYGVVFASGVVGIEKKGTKISQWRINGAVGMKEGARKEEGSSFYVPAQLGSDIG
jgi:hypothetical protein